MKIVKQLKYKIHRWGLSGVLDRLKFIYFYLRNYAANRTFSKKHPHISLPPGYMVYESYGLNYRTYYEGGNETSRWIIDTLAEYTDLTNVTILDWGCGPARLVRHLPVLLPGGHIYGTDYNSTTIEWCRENIPGVAFSINHIQPPLFFQEKYFDIVYGISIFTHLSEANHSAWLIELHRILKPGGLLLLTTQGLAHTTKLTKTELVSFLAGNIVVRTGVKEGHLTYSAFQPETSMRQLLAGRFDIVSFTAGKQETWGVSQDMWVLRKV